jgi:drug/metabolite transporter (DMT)-like permease
MYIYLKVTKQNLGIDRATFWKLSGIGVIIMVHWLSFYGAIKISNISVTMVAFSTGALFSAVFEPIFYKRRVRGYELLTGLVIIAAIAMIFSVETQYWKGFALGIFGTALSSLFGVLNGLLSHKLRPGIISFYELSAALLGLSLVLLFTGNFTPVFFTLDSDSIIGLSLLSLVCTVFPFIKSVDLSKHISPYTIVLTLNLETIYGIIWAIIIYKENRDLTFSFYTGVVIILAAIFLNSYLRRYSEKLKERRQATLS